MRKLLNIFGVDWNKLKKWLSSRDKPIVFGLLIVGIISSLFYIHDRLNWFMPKTYNECVLKNIKKTKNDIQVELIKKGCRYKHEYRYLADKEIKDSPYYDYNEFWRDSSPVGRATKRFEDDYIDVGRCILKRSSSISSPEASIVLKQTCFLENCHECFASMSVNEKAQYMKDRLSKAIDEGAKKNKEKKSSLPKCKGADYSKWTNCFGTDTLASGNKYVGEWKDGKREGQGTFTWADGDKYVGEWKDGKRHGQGTSTSAKGDKYVGEYKDDKRNGQGIYTWADGNKYVGEYKDGKFHGQGSLTFDSGDKYVGEYKDGEYHGQGTYTYADGDKYVGDWKDDKKNGQGTFTWASGEFAGDKYVGEFKDDKRSGQGTYTKANGKKTVGEWKDGKPVESKVEISKGKDLTGSSLPKCRGTDHSKWTNCFGTDTLANGEKYVGDWKDGKYHGQGIETFPDGSKYVGEYKDDKFHGQGTSTSAKGDKYVGEFKDGKRHGLGTYTWASGEFAGDKYVGGWKDDKKNGQGTYTDADGDIYVGEWKDGLENGQGTYTFADGNKYVGELKDGKYHGQGTFTFASGNKYVGEHKDGKYHGQGTYTFANGDIYVGDWKDDKYHGQGTLTFADGGKRIGIWKDGKPVESKVEISKGKDLTGSSLPKCRGTDHSKWTNCFGTDTFASGNKYVGEWKDGKSNGQGTYTWADGDKYVGEFKDGKSNGQGTYTFANGDIYVGESRNAEFHGQGTYTFADGSKYVGEYKDGKHHGQGIETFPDGSKYVGEYKDDKLHGHGTYTFDSGDKYVGEFKDDKRQGQGTYTWADGTIYVGEWKDGKQEGQGTYTLIDGRKYVGDWKDDKRHGQGTYTDADGEKTVGEWKDDKPVKSKSEPWQVKVDEKNNVVVASKNGEVTHGDNLRFRLLKGKCDVVQEYFTFHTILKNPNIKSLKEAVIPIEVNGKKIYSKAMYAIPFLMGHSVWFFNGGYNVEKHIKFYENIKIHKIKILSNDGSIKNFKAEDYFDIIHNEWNVQNVKNVLLEAKDKCEKLSVQTKKSKLESGEYKDTHTLIFNNIEKKLS